MPFDLKREAYEEPRCLLEMHPETVGIPTGRVIEKLDEYLNRNDFASAERHLRYWLEEAESVNDGRGRLTVLNEQIGLYRKMEKESEALQAIENALALAEAPAMDGTVTCGTTLINAATAYKAFGRAKVALPLFEKARSIYESRLDPSDGRIGGLYNNMALTLLELGELGGAETLFHAALNIMQQQLHGEAEAAITWLNLADLAAAEGDAEHAEEKIEACLDRAEALLNTESLPHNGYYAFVCEKCAPVFGYYGYFLAEKELAERAKRIYEGNGGQ